MLSGGLTSYGDNFSTADERLAYISGTGPISSLYLNNTGINMTTSEIWIYDGTIWTRSIDIPTRATADVFAIKSQRDTVYVIGGYDGANIPTSDVWERNAAGKYM